MITQARLDEYRADLDGLGDAACSFVEELIRATMANNPGMSVAELRDEAIDAIDSSLYAFGDQAAELALDLFEEIAADGYGLDVDTAIEDAIDPDMVEGAVRYSARSLVEGDTEAFVRGAADLSRYYVKRSAMENMVRNCERNDLRYARVPSGRETCPFCFMLSSRGFVYRSEQTAGHAHAYHEHCDCVVVPGFKGLPASEQIEGYDPDGMYERWSECRKTARSDSDFRAEWERMTKAERAEYKGSNDSERYRRFENARVMREIETRDWRWLYTGDIPKITFDSTGLEDETRKERPQEIATANRLRAFGVATNFVKDSTDYIDPLTGFVQHVGLADFENGYEIKTLESATSYNTINGYLKNTSKKKNARYVCFDNSAGAIDDDELVGHLRRSRSFRRGRVYIIDSTGLYRFIR